MTKAIYQIKRVSEDGTSKHILLSAAEMHCIEVALEQLAMLEDSEYGSVNPSQFILNQLLRMNGND